MYKIACARNIIRIVVQRPFVFRCISLLILWSVANLMFIILTTSCCEETDFDGIDVNAIYNVDAYHLYTLLFINYPMSFANYAAANDKILPDNQVQMQGIVL